MKCLRSNVPEFQQFPVKELHSSLHLPSSERPPDRLSDCTSPRYCTSNFSLHQAALVSLSSWHSSSSTSSLPLRALRVNADNVPLEEESNFSAPLKLWGSIRRLFDAIIPAGPPCHHSGDSPTDSNVESSLRNETVVTITSANKAHYKLRNKAYLSQNRCAKDTTEQELKSVAPGTSLNLPFSRSLSAFSNKASRILPTPRKFSSNTLSDKAIFDRDDPNSQSTEREYKQHSSLSPSFPSHNSTLTPMEPLSPFKRSRVPIDDSKLRTFRDYPPAAATHETPLKVRSRPSPQSPLKSPDLVSSFSIPTSPTSPRSPCMPPKAFSNKPPRPTPGVVKVIPTSPSEFMPSIPQTLKEKTRHIPRPIPLKRQPSSLAQNPSHLSFSSSRSSSRDIPMFANAASRAYVKSVSLGSGEDSDAAPLPFSQAPTSPVSPKSTHSNIPPLPPRSKIRPVSPTRVKSAMTPTSFTEINGPIQPVLNRKAEITNSGISEVNGSNESKSSVFKSTSSFFQAARGKSFSVSSRLASSLTTGKSDTTISRSLPRNVRRVLRSSKGTQNLKSQPTTQQQSTVPFFKPLQLSEADREENSTTRKQNKFHENDVSSIERKHSNGTIDDDTQDCETSSSFFNVTSSSLFRTSSASTASSASKKSFLATFRPQLKAQGERTSKSKAKSETLPKVFPRGSRPSKTTSSIIPRGRTSGDLSSARLPARNKQEKLPQKPSSSVRSDTLLKSLVPDRPRQSILTGKNLISSRRPPLIPKKSSIKARGPTQLCKDDKEDKLTSHTSSKSNELKDIPTERSLGSNGNKCSLSEDNRIQRSLAHGVKEQSIPSEYVNREVTETFLSPSGDNTPCSEDSFNPDSDESMWCSINMNGVEKTKTVEQSAGCNMDGNSVLLPRTMSVVKFSKNMIDGPLSSTNQNNSAKGWVLVEETDGCEEVSPRNSSSSREAHVLAIKSAIFQRLEERSRNEKEPHLDKGDSSKTSEEIFADVCSTTCEDENAKDTDAVEGECPPNAIDEPLKRFDSQSRPRTEPALGNNCAAVDLRRRTSDSICVGSHRYGIYPAYRMLSDWFESELRESDLSPCVLPDDDDLRKLSHIPPVQWAAQPLHSCKTSHCSHNSPTGSFVPWRAASMPSIHTVVHPNRGNVICPYSTMVWSGCPCVTGISCQSSSPVMHQTPMHTTGGVEQSTSQLLSSPTSIDNFQANYGFGRFTGDFNVNRRIMHLELIQRQLREKIHLSKWPEKTCSPKATGIQLSQNDQHNEECQTSRPLGIFNEGALRQIGMVP